MNRKEMKTKTSNNCVNDDASSSSIVKFCFNKNCCFYGNDCFNGFCSGCWKELHKTKELSGFEKQQSKQIMETKEQKKNPASIRSRRSINEIVKIELNTISKLETTTSLNHQISSEDQKNYKDEKISEKVVGEVQSNRICVEQTNILKSNNKKDDLQNRDKTNYDSNEGLTKKTKNKKNLKIRCSFCPRSIMVIGFDCRCGKRFCIEHRLAKDHCCNFDYRTQGIVELTKENPKIVRDKVGKI